MLKRELLVVVSTAAGTGALLVYLTCKPGLERTRLRQARADVRVMEAAALFYVATHPGACPTSRDLKRAKILDGTRPTTDPWKTEVRIVCRDGGVTAISAGSDKQFDTEDDVKTPQPGGASKSAN